MTSTAGETWGISGPNFLIGYVILTFAGYLIARWIFAPQQRGPKDLGIPLDSLSSPEWGLMRRPEAAVNAAIADLLSDGWLVGTPGRCAPAGRGERPLRTPFHGAVLTAVANAGTHQPTTKQLLADPTVVREMATMRGHLERLGVLTTPARERLAWGLPLVMTAVIALGVARLVAGLNNGKPILYLLAALFFAALFTMAAYGEPRHLTRAGQRLITEKAKANPDLVISKATRKGGYVGGAGRDIGLSVALFGTSALVLAHPAAASAFGIEHTTYGAIPTAGSSGSSYTSSSCSSGGCGSGCGG